LGSCTIANQIAQLLNQNNKLNIIHSDRSIISNNVKYFVEFNGKQIIGCVGLIDFHTIDKIVHLSVDSKFRNMGIGNELLKTAVNKSDKLELFMQIRSDNQSSMKLSIKNGFMPIAYIPKKFYNIITLHFDRRKNV
jgi:ribosomal protein S18 acetylase RimI-like enzyme